MADPGRSWELDGGSQGAFHSGNHPARVPVHPEGHLVFQIQCKLFVFDKTSQSWVERGRGLLRLNDMASTDDGTLQSRLGELQGALCRGCRVPKAAKGEVLTQALHPSSREAGPHRKFPSTHTPWLPQQLRLPALPRLLSF